ELARPHPVLRVLPRRQRRGDRREPPDRLDGSDRADDPGEWLAARRDPRGPGPPEAGAEHRLALSGLLRAGQCPVPPVVQVRSGREASLGAASPRTGCRGWSTKWGDMICSPSALNPSWMRPCSAEAT